MYKNYSVRLYFILFAILINLIFAVSIRPVETLLIIIIIIFTIFIMVEFSKNPWKVLSIFLKLLLLSLFFLPSISIGNSNFRFDDFLVIYMTLFLLILIYKQQVNILYKSKVVKYLLIYLCFSGSITLLRMVFGNLEFIYILFFIKEVQYFIYFAIAYILIKEQSEYKKSFFKIFFIASLITIFWGVYQLLTGKIRGYYGIGIISVQNPSQSGIVFYLITFVMFYMSQLEKRIHKSLVYLGLSIIGAGLAIATISRTAILVLIFSILVYVFFLIFKNKFNVYKIILSSYMLLFSVLLSYKIIESMIENVADRLSYFDRGVGYRTHNWEYFLSKSDTLGYIIGNGKGFMQKIVGTFTLQADNQYVRLILEVGLVGFFLWIMIIVSILIISIKSFKYNRKSSIILIVLTTGFLVIGITQEAYIVAIQGSLYWILMGVLLADVTNKKVEEDY